MNQEKVSELRNWMQKNNVDLAYISDASHIGYFSGFDSNPMERVLALFIPLEKDPFLFAPGLEVEDAKASSFEYDVVGYLDTKTRSLSSWMKSKNVTVLLKKLR